LIACFPMSLRAQQPMTPASTSPAAQAKPAPAKTPATTPLKLRMPFPGVGEVRIPTQDELTMRAKLEQLANLSDADIRAQLEKWPAFSKMNLRDEGAMLQRIQDFRDYRSNVAKAKAHDMGLLTLLPDQEARFEKEYWDKRLQMDRDLAKQFEPILRAEQQKMESALYDEFSSVNVVPVAQAPKSSPSPTASALTTNADQPMQPIAQAPH
jgi:hypothetical protein